MPSIGCKSQLSSCASKLLHDKLFSGLGKPEPGEYTVDSNRCNCCLLGHPHVKLLQHIPERIRLQAQASALVHGTREAVRTHVMGHSPPAPNSSSPEEGSEEG
ncbi:hypothetical protein MTO96_048841 [Rhipicephalus appendiculatus]